MKFETIFAENYNQLKVILDKFLKEKGFPIQKMKYDKWDNSYNIDDKDKNNSDIVDKLAQKLLNTYDFKQSKDSIQKATTKYDGNVIRIIIRNEIKKQYTKISIMCF